ncbi:MAG: outer membrane lipoprotein chaperone LolA [Parasulfuritortus sp.]|jgi:outer membrane lipoprotein carrier protein|nr:outer membrane lipoprotein chaperone LolA [Parasulfuritortus sp.]
MSKTFSATLVALTLALPSCAMADAIQRLHDFAKQTKTLQGTFNQVVYDRKNQKTQDASGEFYFSRPGKFRWVYSKPYEQLIVGDGKKVWIYDADLAQVTEKKMDQAIGESPAALLAGSSEIDNFFNLKDIGQNNGLEWLEATPKGKDGTFAWVRLGFKGSTVLSMELKDNFGQTTLLKFSALKENDQLKPELFSFTPPKGADVLNGL